jgi:hypothetical protein
MEYSEHSFEISIIHGLSQILMMHTMQLLPIIAKPDLIVLLFGNLRMAELPVALTNAIMSFCQLIAGLYMD